MRPVIVIITAIAIACFGAFVLLGAYIDGRRQKGLEHGQLPVTTANGQVRAEEDTHGL